MNETEPQRQFTTLPREETAAVLGMWLFIATEVLFVGALFGAYLLARLAHPTGFAEGSRETELVIGAANTAILLTSSFTMALALRSMADGEEREAARFLWLTAGLGACFLALKFTEYGIDFAHHLVPGIRFNAEGPHARGKELFFFLYFVMTGIHAIHLAIGIALAGLLARWTAIGRFTAEYHAPVENLGLYWHFVDVVWIFLFPLLYLVHRA